MLMPYFKLFKFPDYLFFPLNCFRFTFMKINYGGKQESASQAFLSENNEAE